MTRKQLILKLSGTLTVVMLLVFGILVSTGQAQALIRYVNNSFTATGEVTGFGNNRFFLTTSGSVNEIPIIVDYRTRFQGGLDNLDGLQEGDQVRVRATRENGNFLVANQVRALDDNFGDYGSACGNLRLRVGVVMRIDGDTIRVNKSTVQLNVTVNDDTKYSGGTFDDLKPGTGLLITGDDCAGEGELIANRIRILTQPNGNGNGNGRR